MIVENASGEKQIQLAWEAFNLPSDYQGKLVDITRNKTIDLGNASQYSFNSEKQNAFKILMGKSNYVNAQLEELSTLLPSRFDLAQNSPNPFNPTTTIRFDLAHSGNIKLKVYNTLGQEVTTLASGFYLTGKYALDWNGRDRSGKQVSSGVYIYRLEMESFRKSRKMLLVK